MSDSVKTPPPPGGSLNDLSTVTLDIDSVLPTLEIDTEEPPITPEDVGIHSQDVLNELTKKPSDKYKFRKSIGRGGMKVVIQVKDRDTRRDIAMAILPDAQNRPKRDIVRFIEEARITASLEHPNIVPVHDIGVDSNGSPYFTMKLLRGETLASVLKKIEDNDPGYVSMYPLEKLMRIFLKICNGIAFAHSKGVLHLDLKPENVQVGDFGEVLLMDWGLAKVVTTDEGAVPSDPGRTAKDLPPGFEANVTLDGITKGTPGYMAPEQAAGKNSEKDFRTDIYALGAILYAMVTLKNPLEHTDNVKQAVRDTIAGNLLPPKMRTPDRVVPTALEAVIMKAMALNPNDRYASAKELRDEIYAFLSGYATVAERATPFKKALLFVRRHRITVAAVSLLCVLLLSIGLYALLETANRRGEWIAVYDETFGKGGIPGASFTNAAITAPAQPWHSDDDGLKMVRGEWMWLSEVKIPGNVLVVAEFYNEGAPESLEICINAAPTPLKDSRFVPAGYSCQLSMYGGTLDVISKNIRPDMPEPSSVLESKLRRDRGNTIEFKRINENISVTVNNAYTLSATDLFPLNGAKLQRIGIRSNASSARLKSLTVYRYATPMKSTPVIAGDALVETGHFEDAIEKYLTVAENYPNGPVAEESLAKAYLTAVSAIGNQRKRNEILTDIKRKIALRFNSFKYREKIMEIDVLRLWKDGRFSDALAIMNEILAANPRSTVIQKLLQLPHNPLPPSVRDELIRYIVPSKNIVRLDVSNFGLETLEPLAGMKLVYLNCSSNDLKSLSGIEGMPLEVLMCDSNRISDLTPLSGMPLRSISMRGNLVSDLSSVDYSGIQSMDCSENQISDLTPLSGAALERFFCRKNRISDLTPLHNMPLKMLDAGKNPISDLTPLAEMSLELLRIDETDVSDLMPLRNMPLIMLMLYGCRNIHDFSTLETLLQLEVLSLPKGKAGQIKFLKNSPTLQFISDSSASLQTHGMESAADYWKRNEKELK